MKFGLFCVTAIAALGITSASANGIVVTSSTSLADFQGDVAGPIQIVDFNDVAADTSFSPTPFDAGPFTMGPGSTGLAGSFGNANFNEIDVSPFGGQNLRFNIDGTAHARVFMSAGESLTLTFDTPITAFAAEFLDLNGADTAPGSLRTEILLGTHVEQPGIDADDSVRFLGFASDSAFSSVTFSAAFPGVASAFSFDNVRFVSAPVAVSEPASLALLGLGIAGLAAGMRRRTQK